MTRRLLAALCVGLVLLAGETVRMRHRQAAWFVVGIASTGDTVTMDRDPLPSGDAWLLGVSGPTTHGHHAPSVAVDCRARTIGPTRYAAVLELQRVIIDTACTSPR